MLQNELRYCRIRHWRTPGKLTRTYVNRPRDSPLFPCFFRIVAYFVDPILFLGVCDVDPAHYLLRELDSIRYTAAQPSSIPGDISSNFLYDIPRRK